MENNMENETKAKIFAQHLGQKVELGASIKILSGINEVVSSDNDQRWETYYSDGDMWFISDYCKLLLKPLSAITDEDAIAVAKMLKPDLEHTHNSAAGKYFVKNLFDGDTRTFPIYIHVYQYLQSRGYAIPYMEYSVEDLVKEGIYKLIE